MRETLSNETVVKYEERRVSPSVAVFLVEISSLGRMSCRACRPPLILSYQSHCWTILRTFATASTSRSIHWLEVVAWSVHLCNESPIEEGRSLVLVVHLKVPGVAALEDRSRLHVRASEVLSKIVQVAIIVRSAWLVDTVRLHLQSIDTSELIVMVVGQ